ncbi:MAG: DUF134 domain-containing protein [Paludibacteraceae bacterium]|nr:DUF134 domain-containing protein [Paludibacteraceae bacterium]MBP6284197.1 DUF134 domain-containing protein [Paludibacteraceae bacterium]
MPRPQQHRTLLTPPKMKGFKPFGIPGKHLESVILLYDEYESMRLLDYEGLNQEQAAERMNISRPTLTRIYEKARKTIAQALVEGKMIRIEGGNVSFNSQWYRCKKCYKLIPEKDNHTEPDDCCPCNGEESLEIIGTK